MILSDKIRILLMLGLFVLLSSPVCGDNVLPSLAFDDEPEEVQEEAVTAPAFTNEQVEVAIDTAAPTAVEENVESYIDLVSAQEKGIAFLKGLAEEDGTDGLISPPYRSRTVIERKMVDVRYSLKMIDVPVYKVVEEFRNVNIGDSTDSVMVRKKVKVRKRVGTKQEKRKVLDPEGDIPGQRVKYIYGPGGPDFWRVFEFGYNAMAIYAMIRSGVDPQDEVVYEVAEQLYNIYQEYGLPDLTWDLAWSVAAFSMIEEKKYQDMAEKMAGKLVDGQIDEGPGSGLWGPVCVNTKLLAAMTQKKADYSAFYHKAKERYEANKRPSYEEKAEQALDALRTFSKLIKPVSMLAENMQYILRKVKLSDEMGIITPILLSGYPSWIYNQRSADMESTAIAMFGLKVAKERNVLPDETWRPLDERNRPLIPARRSSDVVQRAVNAIKDAQLREGWTELNRHQIVKDFDNIKGINGVPADASSFKPLADPLTPLSTVQGYAIYSYYAAMDGVVRLRPFARNVIAGNAAVKSVLDAAEFTKPKGKNEPLCELCFYVSETPDLGQPEYDLQAAQTISAHLIESQNEDGSWGRRTNAMKETSSLRERRVVLPGIFDKNYHHNRHHLLDLSKAHVDYNIESPNINIRNQYLYSPKIVNTAYALLALANVEDEENRQKSQVQNKQQ